MNARARYKPPFTSISAAAGGGRLVSVGEENLRNQRTTTMSDPSSVTTLSFNSTFDSVQRTMTAIGLPMPAHIQAAADSNVAEPARRVRCDFKYDIDELDAALSKTKLGIDDRFRLKNTLAAMGVL